ncbi:hypothetical protein [Bradyrhizobium sp. McL0616]|uniref:hypothetical protein n=1 Tax=Bradyrhizobium sp. McL0616 TaxID=3415674 RepID=UPI003CE7E561
MSKPVGPAALHAARAGFPLPPIMSAATEVEDNSDRNRAQGIINGATFPALSGRDIDQQMATTARLFHGPSTGLNARPTRFSNIFGSRDKNTTYRRVITVSPA